MVPTNNVLEVGTVPTYNGLEVGTVPTYNVLGVMSIRLQMICTTAKTIRFQYSENMITPENGLSQYETLKKKDPPAVKHDDFYDKIK